MFTLLIYEQVPEEMSLYLIPSSKLSAADNAVLYAANNKYGNTINLTKEQQNALDAIGAALCPEKHRDDDNYFNIGIPYAWRCKWAQYQVVGIDGPIEAEIERVYRCGFIL